LHIGNAGTRDAYRSTLVILRTSIRPCEIHAPQQIQSGVVLAQRVRSTPRLLPRRRACMHLFAETWKHASTCRRFLITWWLAFWTCPGTELVMHKPRRHSTTHSSQTHGAPAWSHWPRVLFGPNDTSPNLAATP
ncbi:hypothetical protein TcG_10104, partial [Trypanosoma cruzi]